MTEKLNHRGRRGTQRFAFPLCTFVSFVAMFCLPSFGQEKLELGTAIGDVQFVSQIPGGWTTVTAGNAKRVELRFRINPGLHINSNEPRSPLLIPTRLVLRTPTDVGVGRISYPKGGELSFPFAPEEKLSVYSGEFAIGVTVSPARSAASGGVRVHGELRYQACNDRACFPPKKLPVAFDVSVLRAPRTGRNPGQSPHIHR